MEIPQSVYKKSIKRQTKSSNIIYYQHSFHQSMLLSDNKWLSAISWSVSQAKVDNSYMFTNKSLTSWMILQLLHGPICPNSAKIKLSLTLGSKFPTYLFKRENRYEFQVENETKISKTYIGEEHILSDNKVLVYLQSARVGFVARHLKQERTNL